MYLLASVIVGALADEKKITRFFYEATFSGFTRDRSQGWLVGGVEEGGAGVACRFPRKHWVLAVERRYLGPFFNPRHNFQ